MVRAVRREMPRRRRRPFREPRTRILVLCCGKRTEPEYFKGLVQHVRNPSVTVKVKSGISDPAGLVEQAKARLGADDFDQVWCVVDVDEFDIDRAVEGSGSVAGVRLAVSNPCFDLWLLLHFQEQTAYVATCGKLGERLRRRVANYEKAVEFRRFAPGVARAVAGAKRLGDTETDFPNPSTGVWRLVELISSEGTQ